MRYLSNAVGDARCYNKAASDAVDPSQVAGSSWAVQPFSLRRVTWAGVPHDGGHLDTAFPPDQLPQPTPFQHY